MSTIKKGQLTTAREWWKHLRPFLKQDFWGRERLAAREEIRAVQADETCPACGAALLQEKCKVVCRSDQCVYRLVMNCSEF